MGSRNGCVASTAIDATNPAPGNCRDDGRDREPMTTCASKSFAPDHRLSRDEGFALTDYADLNALMRAAAARRDAAHGAVVTYSRKVFIPLTQLCRDVCHYCTFATTPRVLGKAYLNREEVLRIAREGVAAGCREALFTLGDRPEDRYPIARDALDALGHDSTLSYLRE